MPQGTDETPAVKDDEFKDYDPETKIVILGDMGHIVKVIQQHRANRDATILLVDEGVDSTAGMRSEAMRRSFGEIYGKKSLIAKTLRYPTEQEPSKKGEFPEFIKEHNRNHWKRGRR